MKSFSHVTSKEALWPVLHSFPWLFQYENVDWGTFREVNRLFAQAASDQAGDDALIWVHGYNLWLVPKYLREIQPDPKIAFFHHTPFPAPDVFNISRGGRRSSTACFSASWSASTSPATHVTSPTWPRCCASRRSRSRCG